MQFSKTAKDQPDQDAFLLTFRLSTTCDLRVRVGNSIGGGAETGLILWPASLALASWIYSNRTLLGGLSLCELGAGVGLPGLVAAAYALPERVLLTDIIPLTLNNLKFNVAMLSSGAAPVQVHHVDWHQISHNDVPSDDFMMTTIFDVIFGADLVYEPSVLPALCQTIMKLLKTAALQSRNPFAIIASEVRSTETWDEFERQMRISGLQWEDMSGDIRGPIRDSPFYLADDVLSRIRLLRIRLNP